LHKGLEALKISGNFKAKSIVCVGVRYKNKPWNPLRVDVLKLLIQLIEQKKTTVLGVSLFVFAGVGVFKTPELTPRNIGYKTQAIER
jgi:L-fuculokinase